MSKNCEVSSVVFHVDAVVKAANETLQHIERLHNQDVAEVADGFIEDLTDMNRSFLRRIGILKKIAIPSQEEVISALNAIYAPGNCEGSDFENSAKDRIALAKQLDLYLDDWFIEMSIAMLYSQFYSHHDNVTIRRLASLRADTLADTKVTLSINDAALIGLI